MNITAIFIRRPVMTALLMIGIVLFGAAGYRLLPVSDLPNVDFPTIQVSAGLPGASPETMASSVALPLEKQFSTIAGLTAINSNSSLGNTQITLQFDLSRNIDEAATAITAANVNLPTGTMYGNERNFVVQAEGQLLTAASYGPIIISYRNGNPVRLNEGAHVYDGVENDKAGDRFMDKPSIDISISKQPGTNVVQVVDDIKALLPTLSEQFPAALRIYLRSDRSQSIRDSVHDVKT